MVQLLLNSGVPRSAVHFLFLIFYAFFYFIGFQLAFDELKSLKRVVNLVNCWIFVHTGRCSSGPVRVLLVCFGIRGFLSELAVLVST